MAQTKRKRRTKHRGTAAGVIEARGRTGRPPTPEERKQSSKEKARTARVQKPPSWSSAAKRAGLIAVFLFVVLAFFVHGKKGGSPLPAAALISLLALCFYIPTGYYLDKYMYRRQQAKRAAAQKK